jgi:hypothetical protein
MRPGFIKEKPQRELRSTPWSILRYRTARAESHVTKRNILNAEVLMPLGKAREMLTQADEMKKWVKLCLESVEDFDAIMANPDWLVTDRAARIQKITTSMHARLTYLKRTIE